MISYLKTGANEITIAVGADCLNEVAVLTVTTSNFTIALDDVSQLKAEVRSSSHGFVPEMNSSRNHSFGKNDFSRL